MYDHLALSESGFLFDTRTGATYSLSPTGVTALRALMQGVRAGALAATLCQRYDVNEAQAARDLERFVQDLHDLGLLRNDDGDDELAAGETR